MNECFDTAHFVELIRERPAIWDVHAEEYSNKIIKQRCWNDVFSIMVHDFNVLSDEEEQNKSKELQRRWKSLRNSFTREVAKQKETKAQKGPSSRKKYIYFDMLSFLKPTFQNNSLNPSQDPEVESKDSEKGITEEFISTTDGSQRRRRKFDDVENHLQGLKESIKYRSRNDDDCDKLFLLSLHAHLKTIPESKKLFAKAEIIQVLTKYNDPPERGAETTSENWQNSCAAPTPAPHYPPHTENQYSGTYMPQHYPILLKRSDSPNPSEESIMLSTNGSLTDEF